MPLATSFALFPLISYTVHFLVSKRGRETKRGRKREGERKNNELTFSEGTNEWNANDEEKGLRHKESEKEREKMEGRKQDVQVRSMFISSVLVTAGNSESAVKVDEKEKER